MSPPEKAGTGIAFGGRGARTGLPEAGPAAVVGSAAGPGLQSRTSPTPSVQHLEFYIVGARRHSGVLHRRPARHTTRAGASLLWPRLPFSTVYVGFIHRLYPAYKPS